MAAEDTLEEKIRDGSVVSGSHLMTKALNAEDVDVRHESVAAFVLSGA
jgi:hypothetical protein